MQKPGSTGNTTIINSFPIAVITSIFNHQITQALREGTVAQLLKRGFNLTDITLFEVPGAVEIPLVAKRLAIQQKVQSIITLGAIIRGETSHYDLVCTMVSQGCLHVSLEYNIPVLFGILTTDNEQQAWDRLGGKYGHKGIEVANAAISLHQTLNQLQ